MLAEASSTNQGFILMAIAAIWIFVRFMPYILGAFILLFIVGSFFPNDPSVAKVHAEVANLLGLSLVFWIVWAGLRMVLGGRVK